MKKLFSLITSAVMSLCLLSVFPTAAPTVHSADNKPVLTAGNIQLSDLCDTEIKVLDDSIFIGDPNKRLNICTNNKFSYRWSENDGYYIFPESNGNYLLSLDWMYNEQTEAILQYFIECKNNIVDIRYNCFITIEYSNNLPVSIVTAEGKTLQYNSYFFDLPLIDCLNTHLLFDENYWLCYNLGKDSKTYCSYIYFANFNDTDQIVATDFSSSHLEIDGHEYKFSDLAPENVPVPSEITVVSSDLFLYDSMIDLSKKAFMTLKWKNANAIKYINFYVQDEYVDTDSFSITDYLRYDLNNDEKINVADLVILKKALLGSKIDDKTNWQAADANNNNALDVFDLVAMRKALIASQYYYVR